MRPIHAGQALGAANCQPCTAVMAESCADGVFPGGQLTLDLSSEEINRAVLVSHRNNVA